MNFIRGDSFPFKFKINSKEGTLISKEDIDTLILTCREYPNKNSKALFTKDINDFLNDKEYYHGIFKPEDTENLKYQTYYFDIEVTLKNNYRKTLYDSFTLTEECSFHGKEGE